MRKYPITLHAPMLDAFFSFLSHRPPRDFLLCAFADALFPSTDSGELNGKRKLSEARRVLRDSANLIVLRCFRENTASTKAANTKHQAPKKLQSSSSKPRSERWGRHPAAAGRGLGLGIFLELGTWDLELLRVTLADKLRSVPTALLCPLRAHHIGIRNHRIGEIAFKFLKNPAQAFLQA